MAPRLEYHWLPAVKYTSVLMVYLLSGSMLMFYIEECRNNSNKIPKARRRIFTGNITAVCLNLALQIFQGTNGTSSNSIEKDFMSRCSTLLSQEKLVDLEGYGDCSWNGRSVRKWIKFVHNTLTTIGECALALIITGSLTKLIDSFWIRQTVAGRFSPKTDYEIFHLQKIKENGVF